MKRLHRHSGFSLTEVLLAAGILVIGFLLICATLPVGVHLTAKGTERNIGAVVAEEAFAKIQLFGVGDVNLWNTPQATAVGVDPNTAHVDYQYLWARRMSTDLQNFFFPGDNQFAYPSTPVWPDVHKYHWSALLRYNLDDLGDETFQVTVFISRTAGLGAAYPMFDNRIGLIPTRSPYPRPVPIPVEPYNPDPANPLPPLWDQIRILTMPTDPAGMLRTVTDESVLLDDRTGRIMRVLRRPAVTGNVNDPPIILLDGHVFDTDVDLDGQPDTMRYVWVLPPAVGGGRYPGIAVYQRVLKFNKP